MQRATLTCTPVYACSLACARALVRMQTREVALLCFANANVCTQQNACIAYTYAYIRVKIKIGSLCTHQPPPSSRGFLLQDTVSQLGCVVLLSSYQAYFKWLATSKRCTGRCDPVILCVVDERCRVAHAAFPIDCLYASACTTRAWLSVCPCKSLNEPKHLLSYL